MRAVFDACRDGRLRAIPGLVVCNNRRAGALATAEEYNVPYLVVNARTHESPEEQDLAILHALQTHDIDLLILAGYLWKLGHRTLDAYKRRAINIHPSLLPKYGGAGMYGLHVHQAVIDAGDPVTGISIHSVTEEYDQGPILRQMTIPLLPTDSPESLAARVLAHEHTFLVETLELIIAGKLPIL